MTQNDEPPKPRSRNDSIRAMSAIFFPEAPLPTDAELDAEQRLLEQGGERLREALSSVPFYANAERKAMEQGGPERVKELWTNLFANERNLHRPPKTNGPPTAKG